jgi:uncharacterized membrane protein YqjE
MANPARAGNGPMRPLNENAARRGVVHEPTLGQLFGRLSEDASRLVQDEVALAKLELRESLDVARREAVQLGVALVMGGLAGLALTTALVIGLGVLLGNYWLSALIVGVLLMGIGALLARRAAATLRDQGITPEATLDTLKGDADWAKREAREFKRNLTA